MWMISIGLLGMAAALSCALAFRWLEIQWRRNLFLSLLVGLVCILILSLGLAAWQGRALCVLLMCGFIPVISEDRSSAADLVAADSMAAAAFGMLGVVCDTFLSMKGISVFFAISLILLCYVGAATGIYNISADFPEKDWQETFFSGRREKREWFLLFIALGVSCALPMLFSVKEWPVLALEIFAFFCGIKLLTLMISHRKEKQSAMTEKHYRDDMQTYMSVIRSQRHDYNFHVQTLHGLLLQKDYAGCEKYLQDVLEDSIQVNRLLTLADPAIGALILSFQGQAQSRGIPMTISIENDLSAVVTNVYETNKIIGNLLQNAIDETEQLADKSYGVRLSILKRGEFCLIHVSNQTRTGDPMKDYHVGKSEKQGHEGIGISAIRALAARHGGVVYSRVEGDVIYFVAKIPLKLAD